jgi:phosphate acetyltransferase
MAFLETLFANARTLQRTVAFPDALDVRTLHAARTLVDESVVSPVLVGNEQDIQSLAMTGNISLRGVHIADPATDQQKSDFAETFHKLRKAKGMTAEKARETMLNPLFFAAMMLRQGRVHASVGGSVSSTADILRAGIQAVGIQAGIATVSSFFVMILQDRIVAFGDCAVVPQPTAAQLADIALTTAVNFQRLTALEPRVALLSFSTKGSAEHENVTLVREALAIAKGKSPTLRVDGELQFDASFVPDVAKRKAPDSAVAGRANVYIFPDLNSGNIGYKIAERLGGAQAVGPVVQGLQKPYFDLSRGCKADDIVAMAAIGALMS